MTDYDEAFAHVFTRCFTQHSLQSAMNKFGEPAKDAAFKEMKQLHDRIAFDPLDVANMMLEERQKALESLIFVKEKCNETLKGRVGTDGRKQCEFANLNDAASPTALLESIVLTAIIDTKEEQDVATIDISNAFIQTDMEGEKAVVKLRGKLA